MKVNENEKPMCTEQAEALLTKIKQDLSSMPTVGLMDVCKAQRVSFNGGRKKMLMRLMRLCEGNMVVLHIIVY